MQNACAFAFVLESWFTLRSKSWKAKARLHYCILMSWPTFLPHCHCPWSAGASNAGRRSQLDSWSASTVNDHISHSLLELQGPKSQLEVAPMARLANRKVQLAQSKHFFPQCLSWHGDANRNAGAKPLQPPAGPSSLAPLIQKHMSSSNVHIMNDH